MHPLCKCSSRVHIDPEAALHVGSLLISIRLGWVRAGINTI